jgi:hypothetical protein
MNIDDEYADKKKQRESQLCQQLISQCENKQLIYEKGFYWIVYVKINFSAF